jgi:CheY-like chemotaxis protein
MFGKPGLCKIVDGSYPHGVLFRINCTVLVIDDSEDTADMLKALLTESGALVMAATSGSDALRIGAEFEFDVVLSDISMPGNGWF